jgi:hypothetical protein
MNLASDIRLSIDLETDGIEEWIKLKLEDRTNLVEIDYPVGQNTLNQPYHREEAMVIGLRRLIRQAIKEGLICVCPGVSTNSGINFEAVDLTLMPGNIEFIQSWTGLE